jgi:hypothetical protein
MKGDFKNSRKDTFLATLPIASIDAIDDRLTSRCKFNFGYFHVDPAGQSFDEWGEAQIRKLLDKLKDYSRESLRHWRSQRLGAAGTVLAVYGAFPQNSDFVSPRHVPHQAQWARFRLETSVRLVGFILPHECHGKEHPGTRERFDCNTFYVVFLDADHRFYKIEAK